MAFSTTSTTSSQMSAGPKAPRILACVLCQHRKIKCDRTFPCANCTKANVKCTPSTPAPARKRRRPNQDLQERLARCEELLKEYATAETKTDSPAPHPVQNIPLKYDDPYLRWQPTGKLVREDGGVRFMDNFLFGTIYDELRAMREIIDADDNDEITPDSMTPDDNSDLLLGGLDSPSQTAEELWPEPGHVFRLWQLFLDRVHPLTKIIHVPTLQPYLAEATSGSHNIPKNVEVLLFSIYLMAVVALTPEECLQMLGCSREQSLQRYSTGVRLGLLRMGFLKSHDLTTLQALVIYLISLQGRYNRHAAWVLNGVVIRIAQKMGLHRDGELLGLGPFDTEMRRRLWWQIIMLDAKYAMLSGLSHSLLPRSWDTKEPRNVNDVDLFPSATEPFQDRDGPTEMIFCLMTNKVAKFLVQNPGLEAMILATELDAMKYQGALSESQYAEFRNALGTLRNDLVELLDKCCDPNAGAVHQATLEMKNHILDKLGELTTPPREQAEWGKEILTLKDNAFKIAVSSMEHNELNYESTKDRGFLWFTKLHFAIDVFMYMAGQLCHRTEGSLVERGWKQVSVVYSYHTELFDVSNKTYSTLAIFILKAWNTREELFRSHGQRIDTPFYVEKLRAVMPDDIKSEPTPIEPSPQPSFSYKAVPHTVTHDPAFDQFLGGYLGDVGPLDWDMFGATSGTNPSSTVPAVNPMGQPHSFSFGTGPTHNW